MIVRLHMEYVCSKTGCIYILYCYIKIPVAVHTYMYYPNYIHVHLLFQTLFR